MESLRDSCCRVSRQGKIDGVVMPLAIVKRAPAVFVQGRRQPSAQLPRVGEVPAVLEHLVGVSVVELAESAEGKLKHQRHLYSWASVHGSLALSVEIGIEAMLLTFELLRCQECLPRICQPAPCLCGTGLA